ncbi:MAG TPA: NADP-dependent isocitrate dehydrogenase, partial [Pedococcus sp.]|nr:NADP-dependent isocitrate dehydrogenase [Pedococcus sp.]
MGRASPRRRLIRYLDVKISRDLSQNPRNGAQVPDSTIIYTHTDEAPALATASLLPIVQAFAGKAGVEV